MIHSGSWHGAKLREMNFPRGRFQNGEVVAATVLCGLRRILGRIILPMPGGVGQLMQVRV